MTNKTNNFQPNTAQRSGISVEFAPVIETLPNEIQKFRVKSLVRRWCQTGREVCAEGRPAAAATGAVGVGVGGPSTGAGWLRTLPPSSVVRRARLDRFLRAAAVGGGGRRARRGRRDFYGGVGRTSRPQPPVQ